MTETKDLIALHDMEFGLPRKEALQRMRDRVDVDSVRTLVLGPAAGSFGKLGG